MMRYLNNAGAGVLAKRTYETVVSHLDLEREVGAYDAAKRCRAEYEGFYDLVAKLIGSRPSEIAFVDSASRAWNVALAAIGMSPGDRIITLSSEFGSNLVSLFRMAKERAAEVIVLPCDHTGRFDMEAFERASEGAALIAVSHSAAHGSIVNPVAEIGAVAKRVGARYLVDGCQAVGQLPVDVKAIACDAYTGTGRKWLRGPRGTGFLYVRADAGFVTTEVDLSSADLQFAEGTREVVDVQIRNDARQFELWERSVASMLGLAVAVEEACEAEASSSWRRIGDYGNRIRASVVANPKLRLIGEEVSPVGNVGFFCADPSDELRLSNALDAALVSYSAMKDWDFPLHFPDNGATQVFRLSPHYYTPEETVDVAVQILNEFR